MLCNIENLCDSLVKFYNTSILSRADVGFRDACFEEAERCSHERKQIKDSGKIKREVLMKLIQNHKRNEDPYTHAMHKKPIAEFIGGPFTLTMQWSEKYKKLIYIFGENHNYTTDCSTQTQLGGFLIEDYMWQMITKSDCFIDFYIELPGYSNFRYRQSEFSTTRLHRLWDRFRDCIQKSTLDRNIECNLSRVHYFDIRQIEGVALNSMSLLTIKMIDETDRIIKFFNRGAEKGCRRILDLFFNGHAFSRSLLDEICKITTENEYLQFWQKQIEDFDFLNQKAVKTTKEEAQKIKAFIDEQLSSAVNEGFKNRHAIISAQNIRDIINEYLVKQDMEEESSYFDFWNYLMKSLKLY